MSQAKNSDKSFSSDKIIFLANTITVALTEGLTASEEDVLGNLFTMVGATILAKAAIDEAAETSGKNNEKDSGAPEVR